MVTDFESVADIIRAHVGRVLGTTSRRRAVRRDDLEQAGRIGVWRASVTYRKDGGASWRTWAGLWVRAYVEREAWGSSHNRSGTTAMGRLNTLSLGTPLHKGSGESWGDVLPDTSSSPECRVIAKQCLETAIGVLCSPASGRAKFDVPRAMERLVTGETLREVARAEGVSFQAVSQNAQIRLAKARAVLEGA